MPARHVLDTLHALASGLPVVTITWPRKSGKTTLARTAFSKLTYVNFEDPNTRELDLADPRRFFACHPDGAVLDEVQRAPQLMAYLRGIADASAVMGRQVLTGSQQLRLMNGIGQSLAGYVGMLTLLPLAHAELPPLTSLEERLWRCGHPALHAQHRDPLPAHWFAGYLAT